MNIREIRHRLGMSQTEFAKKLGVSRQSVSNWERENFKPTPAIARVIQDYCKRQNIKIE